MAKTEHADRVAAVRALRALHSKESRARAVVAARSEESRGVAVAARKKAFEVVRKQLAKKYKGEVFTTIASGARADNIIAVRSGWEALDDLITGESDGDARTIPGSGLGWPRGRIIEIFGDEGMGKTTLTLQIIAAFQRAGLDAAFIDAEHALDVSYAAKLGVDLTSLAFNQPDHGGGRALTIVNALCKSGLFGVVVVDSVAALEPNAETTVDDFEHVGQPGQHARLMSKALRRLTYTVAKYGTLLIFTNQTRLKIGVRFGNPKTTTGGQALKFYASIRLEMVNVKTNKKGDRVMYRRTRIRTVKNKCAPPFRDVYADIAPNKGIIEVHGESPFDSDSDDD